MLGSISRNISKHFCEKGISKNSYRIKKKGIKLKKTGIIFQKKVSHLKKTGITKKGISKNRYYYTSKNRYHISKKTVLQLKKRYQISK